MRGDTSKGLSSVINRAQSFYCQLDALVIDPVGVLVKISFEVMRSLGLLFEATALGSILVQAQSLRIISEGPDTIRFVIEQSSPLGVHNPGDTLT